MAGLTLKYIKKMALTQLYFNMQCNPKQNFHKAKGNNKYSNKHISMR